MKIHRFAYLVIALLLPCGSSAESYSSYGPIYASYKLSSAKGGGCISGSIGTVGPNNPYSSIAFVSEENAESTLKQAAFGYAKGGRKRDFAPRLSTFTMCLKPGRYQIFGIATNNVYSRERIAVPFEVLAGRNVYLGSFVFQAPGTSPQCERGAAPVYVAVRDEFERDSPIIKGDPQATGLPLDKQLIDPALGAPYLVACSSPTGA